MTRKKNPALQRAGFFTDEPLGLEVEQQENGDFCYCTKPIRACNRVSAPAPYCSFAHLAVFNLLRSYFVLSLYESVKAEGKLSAKRQLLGDKVLTSHKAAQTAGKAQTALAL